MGFRFSRCGSSASMCLFFMGGAPTHTESVRLQKASAQLLFFVDPTRPHYGRVRNISPNIVPLKVNSLTCFSVCFLLMHPKNNQKRRGSDLLLNTAVAAPPLLMFSPACIKSPLVCSTLHPAARAHCVMLARRPTAAAAAAVPPYIPTKICTQKEVQHTYSL